MSENPEQDEIEQLLGESKRRQQEEMTVSTRSRSESRNSSEAQNETTASNIRYDRQNLIPGWKQDKLSNARMVILGGHYLGAYAAITATALGIGRVTLMDDEQDRMKRFLNYTLSGSRTDAKELGEIISEFNPLVNVKGITASLINDGSKYFLEGHDIILDLTNDPISKALAAEYAHETKTPLISASSRPNYSKLVLFDGNLDNIHNFMTNFKGLSQDPITSLPIASIAVEEARKLLMKKDKLEGIVYYTLADPSRFTFPNSETLANYDRKISRDGVAILVGAGALGNGMALNLPFLGFEKVYVVDPDVIEETNLNRQILFYESVGKNKAEVLAEKLNGMGVNAKAIVDKFPIADRKFKDATIIFDCVDNFRTRFNISQYAVQNNLALISGATDYQAGQVAVFVPGQTSCVNHQLNLEEAANRADEAARQSCIYAPNPSVVTSNMIISGLMAGEAKALSYRLEPVHGILKYGSELGKRLGFTPLSDICDDSKKLGLEREAKK